MNKWLCLFLIFLASFISFSWVGQQKIVSSGDFQFPLDPQADFQRRLFTWDDTTLAPGTGNFGISRLPLSFIFSSAYKAGLSLTNIEKLLFFSLIFLSGISMFIFAYNAFFKKKAALALFAAFFYMFNPFISTFKIPNTTISLFSYAPFPLVFHFFRTGLSGKRPLSNLILFAFSSLLLTPSSSTPTFPLLNWILLSAYFIFFFLSNIKSKAKRKRILSFFISSIIVFLLINLWWILPLARIFLEQESSLAEFAKQTADQTLIVNSSHSSILEIFRLLGMFGLYSGYHGESYYPFAQTYLSKPFTLIGFLIFAISIMPFFSSKTNRRSKFLFFGFSWLIFIFLMQGVHPPFGFIYDFAFRKIPGFYIFRSSYTKWGQLFIFCYAVLFALGVQKLLIYIGKWFREKRSMAVISAIFIFFLVFGVYNFPFWSGEITPRTRKVLKPANFSIPAYYWETMSHAPLNRKDCKIVYYPPLAVDGQVVFNWGYEAANPTYFFLKQPLVQPIQGEGGVFDLAYQHLSKNGSLSPILASLNACGILVDTSREWRYYGEEPAIDAVEYLQKAGLEPSYVNTNLYFFPLDDASPHIYAAMNEVAIFGTSQTLIETKNLPFFPSDTNFVLFNSEIVPSQEFVKNGAVFDLSSQNPLSLSSWKENDNGQKPTEVFYPYVKWKPGEFLYHLAQIKENVKIYLAKSQAKKELENRLFFAAKRISEMEKWAEIISPSVWKNIIGSYYSHLKRSFELVTPEQKSYLMATIDSHLDKLNSIYSRIADDQEKEKSLKLLFTYLEKKKQELGPQNNYFAPEYLFTPPEEGNYSLAVKTNFTGILAAQEPPRLEKDGIPINFKEKNGFWMAEDLFLKKEPNKFSIVFPRRQVNLNEWQNNLSVSTSNNGSMALSLNSFWQNPNNIYHEIPDYEADTFYLVTFDYESNFPPETKLYASVGELNKNKAGETVFNPLIKLELPNTRDELRRKEVLFRSSRVASRGQLFFSVENSNEIVANASIKNVKVEKVPMMTVFLIKKGSVPEISPAITFQKINPVKYLVDVRGATSAFSLVFLENYSRFWEVYLTDNAYPGIDPKFTYWEGEVKEGEIKNDYFVTNNTNNFLTSVYLSKGIRQKDHSVSFGYANSWKVDPQGKTDFRLVIEYAPQRLYFLGIVISVSIMVAFILLFLIRTLAERGSKK